MVSRRYVIIYLQTLHRSFNWIVSLFDMLIDLGERIADKMGQS